MLTDNIPALVIVAGILFAAGLAGMKVLLSMID